jgi:hypothetical protein
MHWSFPRRTRFTSLSDNSCPTVLESRRAYSSDRWLLPLAVAVIAIVLMAGIILTSL